MAKEEYLLSKDQLDFIRFMSDNTGSDFMLKDRVNKCISKLQQKNKPNGKIQLVHSPQKTIDLFSLFSRNDDFKWFTHKWDRPDADFDINWYIENQSRNFKFLDDYTFGKDAGIPLAILNHLKNFINLEEKYKIYDQTGKLIPFTWFDTLQWCKGHPGKWPGHMPTDDGRLFETWIKIFKRTIEFRTDVEFDKKFGVQTKKFIKNRISPEVADITFTETFLKTGRSIGFYCYVNGLYEGLTKILDWIEAYKALSNKVTVDLGKEDDSYRLVIMHSDSYFSCDEIKLNGMRGDLKELRGRLFSVCDLSIEADRENDKPIRVCCLDKDTRGIFSLKSGGRQFNLTPCRLEELDYSPGGVKYILKLYIK